MIKRGSKLFSAHDGAIQELTIVDICLDGDDIWPLPIIVMINQYGERIKGAESHERRKQNGCAWIKDGN